MKIEELKDYENWIGKSPASIALHVKRYGGWSRVFPASEKFPIWASRVRNYFNREPRELKLLPKKIGKNLADRANRSETFGGIDGFLASMALSDDVYVDRGGRYWYEMSTAGAVYHYEDRTLIERSHKKVKAIKAKATPQALIPVFKLVSPDGMGGSHEVCIHNYLVYQGVGGWALLGSLSDLLTLQEAAPGMVAGKSEIGPTGKWTDVDSDIVQDEINRGSFNYSETIRMGLSAHDHRDIKPHLASWTRNDRYFYVNPSRRTKFADRRFPRHDAQRIVIGDFFPRSQCTID